jgi:hypothetical protein
MSKRDKENSASGYYVTAADLVSNPQTMRPREFSCLCRKLARLWIFILEDPSVSDVTTCRGVSEKPTVQSLNMEVVRLSETSVTI